MSIKHEDLAQILKGLMTDNHLLPASVVEFAKPESSPLHGYFTWDDTEAAREYRLFQASNLIRSVTINCTLDSGPVEMRAFVSVPGDRVHGAGYRTIEEVVSNDFLRTQLVNDMLKQAELWEKRAAILGVSLNTAPIKRLAKNIKSHK